MIQTFDLNYLEIINNGYQNENRADSYELTQPYVIDKDFFFEKIIQRLKSAQKKNLKILELGCGPAFFLRKFAKNYDDKEVQIELYGADISESMINIAKNKIQDQLLKSKKEMDINFYYNVNLIDLSSDFYKKLDNIKFDLIVSSQFDHYFPNDTSSELAKRISNQNLFTKTDFYKHIYNMLNDNGIFASIDDYFIDDETTAAWDIYVLKNFQNQSIYDEIRKVNAILADKIAHHYHNKDENILLEEIKTKREQRRYECFEEIDTLENIKKVLVKIYSKNLEIYNHNKLGNFFLFLATK
jgi:SAM-dependent methyltransferase